MKLWIKMTSLLRLISLAGLALVATLGMVSLSVAEVLPGSKAAGLESCIAPTADMRRNHMDKLFHKRDQTMRQGIRTPDASINECVSCHAAKDQSGHFVPVTEEGQFCQGCHERVAVKLDCFQCHRTTPESKPKSN